MLGSSRKSLEWNNSRFSREDDCMGINNDMERNNCSSRVSEKTDRKGIKVFGEELEKWKKHWNRSDKLPKWDVTINPL